MTRLPHSPGLRRLVSITLLAFALAFPLGVVLASHQFSDVPNGHLFHADIDAIATSNVTFGCGGGRYCPEDFVTRGQMAAFMNRLGALSPDQAPKVNASKVDGYDANALGRTARGVGSGIFTTLTTSFADVASVSIDVPGAGFVIVNASASLVSALGSSCPCTAQVRLHSLEDGSDSPLQLADVGANLAYASMGASYVFPVTTAGAKTFTFQAAQYTLPGGTGPFGPFNVVLDATYTPFGSTGGTTLGSDEPVDRSGDIPGLP